MARPARATFWLAACSAFAVVAAGCAATGSVGHADAPGASGSAGTITSTTPADHPAAPASTTRAGVASTTARPARSAPVIPAAMPTALAIPTIGLSIGHATGSRVGTVASRTVDGIWTITPPEESWVDLQSAYWWSQQRYSALPGSPSAGTTFLYMHACLQVHCAGNDLHRLRYGDAITLTTRTGVLHYRVVRLLRLDKTPQGVGNNTTLYSYGRPNQLRLVTCGYAADGSSPFNWAVIATLRMPA